VSSSKTIFRASLLALTVGAAALIQPAMAQDAIEVQSLDALDPMEIGLPDAGLRENLWDGTHADMARLVMQALPDANSAGYESPTQAALARAVLATGGYPPSGARGRFDLAALRTDRLLAAAGAFDAFDLLERTPNLNRSSDMSYWHAELAFALGDNSIACRVADALLTDRDQPHWLRTRAFCLALNGQGAAAELTAELARSSEADAGFDALLFGITLESGVDGEMPALDSGLKLAMARRHADFADVEITVSSEAPGWMLRLSQQMSAAILTPSQDPSADLIRSADLTGDARIGVLESVLGQSMDREAAASALAMLLDDARTDRRFYAAALRYGREVQLLPMTADTLAHGFDFAMAALIADDLRVARRWREGLIDGPERNMLAADESALKPIGSTELVGSDVIFDAADVDDTVWEAPSARNMMHLDLALAIMDDRLTGGAFDAVLAAYLEAHGDAGLPEIVALTRLGARPPAGLRQRLFSVEAGSSSAMSLAMEAAMNDRAQAETGLLALAVLASSEEAGASADDMARIAGALDAVGLRPAALGLVLERVAKRAR
jgi:hypothetical protein